MHYKHTQIGYLILFILLAVTLLFGVVLEDTETDLVILVFMPIILFIVASFSSLNVMVDENYLRIKFGYGIFRKKFLLDEIASAKVVKNHWYYGWGIRLWMFPKMWIYNVSGFDAVEIIMKDGKRYRIGTDEPQRLEQAIIRAIK
ncbi:hypothetical protein ACFL22_00065 [Patescibacteria group bacterium]